MRKTELTGEVGQFGISVERKDILRTRSNGPHGVTSQKTGLFITTAVRT
jgi:hypothetical protein